MARVTITILKARVDAVRRGLRASHTVVAEDLRHAHRERPARRTWRRPLLGSPSSAHCSTTFGALTNPVDHLVEVVTSRHIVAAPEESAPRMMNPTSKTSWSDRPRSTLPYCIVAVRGLPY